MTPHDHQARRSVAFVTLGCPKNEVDSAHMEARLAPSFTIVPAIEEADVVVVNTCAFIEQATQESVDTVMDLAGGWRGSALGRRLIVAGCLPSRYGEELAVAMPEVDAFVPVADEERLAAVLCELFEVTPRATPGVETRTAAGPSAYLKVSDGCHRACSFCAIPAIRGPYRSVPAGELMSEARQLVDTGAREIVLVGQDVSAWGSDLPGRPVLADLVTELVSIEELAWLRLMYVQPDGVTPQLLEAMASSPKVCRYLDIPLQHASAPILRAMCRRGRDSEYLALIGAIRDALPGVHLRSTFICGFPGETRADADVLVRFLVAARLDYAGLFAYSPEEGTAAACLHPRVPARTARARVERLRAVADEIGVDLAAAHVGRTLEVLVEEVGDDGRATGRHRGQAPDVDGDVTLTSARPLAVGSIVEARITEACGYDLVGEVRKPT